MPCHRVIGANGTLTGFGGGIDRKRTLLALESPGSSGAPLPLPPPGFPAPLPSLSATALPLRHRRPLRHRHSLASYVLWPMALDRDDVPRDVIRSAPHGPRS
ncbi:MAG: MGMT family protein [Nocardioidaceae bacterium]